MYLVNKKTFNEKSNLARYCYNVPGNGEEANT
jgi:hypothetical protein